MMILAFSGIISSNLNMGVADCRNSYERLTLLHSEGPKLHRVLALLSVKGL